MRKYIIQATIIFFIAFFCQACRNPGPTPIFTIKLRVLNGTTHKILPNQVINLWFERPNHIPSTFKIGDGTTDSLGLVTIKYNAIFSDTARVFAILKYGDKFVAFANRNINDTLYISDSGTMKIFLHTNNPLESDNDTLFLCFNYQFKSANSFEKVFKTTNGLYKIKRYSTIPNNGFFWGRTWPDFHYSTYYQAFISPCHTVNTNVRGDPYIDSVTLNY